MYLAGMPAPAAHVQPVIAAPVAGDGVSVKVWLFAPASSAADDVVIVMTPAATTGASAYLVSTSLQPASAVASGSLL